MLCFTLYLRSTSKYKPPGAYVWRGDLTEGFLCYEFGGLIFVGAYTWRGLFSEFHGTCVEVGRVRVGKACQSIANPKKTLQHDF